MTPHDGEFLSDIAYMAAAWWPHTRERPRPPKEEMLAVPEVARYVDGFGSRAGDRGFVATVDGTPIGGAWFRLFGADEQGYGFIDERTPELGIAVLPEYRSSGTGGVLLAALIVQAKLDERPALSLSVGHGNRARHLYEAMGFVPVRESDRSTVMIKRFD